MRRPSSPTFGLNVPHRIGAARLPQSRKGGSPVGVGWRGHKAPSSSTRGSSVITITLWVFFTVVVGAAIVAAVINPRWVRRPPDGVLFGLLGIILAMTAAWSIYFVISTVREKFARRARARARREKRRDSAA